MPANVNEVIGKTFLNELAIAKTSQDSLDNLHISLLHTGT